MDERHGAPPTIKDLLFSSGQPDSSVAIIGVEGEEITYGQLRELTGGAAGCLNRMGFRNSDRIAVALPNGPLLAYTLIAVSSAFGCAPLNPGYHAQEFENLLNRLKAKALLVKRGMDSPARDVARSMGIEVVDIEEPIQGEPFLISGLGDLQSEPQFSGPGEDAFLLHTSGTTGAPKLVPLTQSNICHTAFFIAKAMQLGWPDRCLNVMPLFHGLGLVSLLSTLLNGGSIVCASGFNPGEFFSWLERLKPTWYTAVPPIHQTILDMAPSNREAIAKTRLRFIRSAASALQPKLMLGLEACFNAPVLEAYGMTEAFIIGSNPPPPGKRKPGSVGVASGPEVAIMGESGALLGRDKVGEIVVRGPNVMRGYEGDPEENARTFINGWLRTGDIGHIDGEGYIFIDGRVKEIINRGGEKVTPNEVDDILAGHPSVKEAATFALPHYSLGEDVAAAVVLREGATVSEDELRHFVLERLVPYKVPTRLYFVEAIPKGPSGKILRRKIPELLGLPQFGDRQKIDQGVAASSLGQSSKVIIMGGTKDDSCIAQRPNGQCIHHIFEKVAAEDPSRIAFSTIGVDISYGELNSRANRLARLLLYEGVGPGQFVGVCMERALELVISLIAVLKTGAAYLPLYPSDPAGRVASQVEGAGVKLAITKRVYDSMIPPGVKKLYIHSAMSEAASLDGDNICMPLLPESPAYTLFVSSPDGQQKGVCVPHRAVVGLVVEADYISVGRDDSVAFQSSPNTNLAAWEIWVALLNGARLVMFALDTILSPKRFAKRLVDDNVTVLGLNTPFFNLFSSEAKGAFSSLKTLIFTGEVADPRSVRRVFEGGPPGRLINAYGSTETTAISTWHLIKEPPAPEAQIPIGVPASNAKAYILDDRLEEVPAGSTGQLYIGGDAVALGYMNDPEATRDCFLQDPFCPGGRIFKTGDLARKTLSGAIEFLGRVDRQVKVHGFRVELGEIEKALMEYPSVEACVVSYSNFGGSSERVLVAHVAPRGAEVPKAEELRSFLTSTFRDYMIPSQFIWVEASALARGGTPEKATPLSPTDGGVVKDGGGQASVEDSFERRLIEIWEGEMGLKGIKPNDNFFHVGGYSLMAVRVFSRIEEHFGVKLPLSKIYRKPTVAALAAELKKAQPKGFRSLVPLRAGGKRQRLFIVHPIGGEIVNYGELVEALGEEQPVYAFRAVGLYERVPLPSTIEEMARSYIEEMKVVQPKGPYHLAGWCAGGVVAFEMAQQLNRAGDEVGLVAILDFEAPEPEFWGSRRNARGMLLREALYLGADLLKYAKRRKLAKSLEIVPRVVRLEKVGMRAAGIITGDEVMLHGEFTPLPDDWKAVILNMQRALRSYRTSRYDGAVTVFKRNTLPLVTSPDPTDGWRGYADGGIVVMPVGGRMHYAVVRAPWVCDTASGIKERMDWHEKRIRKGRAEG